MILLSTPEIRREYLDGVLSRAGHHAQKVLNVVEALFDKVSRIADRPLWARTHLGKPANVIWADIKGHRYAFSYDHDEEKIVARDRSIKGAVVAHFEGAMSLDDFVATISKL